MKHDEIVPANDEDNAVDLLIRALRIIREPVTRSHIEMALLNEGRRIAASLPHEVLATAVSEQRAAARSRTKRAQRASQAAPRRRLSGRGD